MRIIITKRMLLLHLTFPTENLMKIWQRWLKENLLFISIIQICKKIDLTYPSHEEQIQISGYFGALDHLITLRVLSIRIEKKVNYFYEVTTSD